jgi:hypothetical protein
MPPQRMDELIASCGRTAQQRTTLYAAAPAAQRERSYAAQTLAPIVLTPAGKRARIQNSEPAIEGLSNSVIERHPLSRTT